MASPAPASTVPSDLLSKPKTASPAKAPQLRASILFAHGSEPPSKDQFIADMGGWLGSIADVRRVTFEWVRFKKKEQPGLDELVPELLEEAERLAADDPQKPIFLAGRSSGCRVCLLAEGTGKLPASVRGHILFSLQLADDTGKVRKAVLKKAKLPVLFVSGTKDTTCALDTLRSVVGFDGSAGDVKLAQHSRLFAVEGASHCLAVPKAAMQDDIDRAITRECKRFMEQVLGLPSGVSPSSSPSSSSSSSTSSLTSAGAPEGGAAEPPSAKRPRRTAPASEATGEAAATAAGTGDA